MELNQANRCEQIVDWINALDHFFNQNDIIISNMDMWDVIIHTLTPTVFFLQNRCWCSGADE